jgi:putative FmdB family regulatory protein
MPTYEYRCEACRHEFEKFQSITAPPIKKCPECGKNKVKRLISKGAGLIFKGSGFYITDYRDAGYQEKAKAETGGEETKKSDAPASDTKTETKADAKTEANPAEAKPKAEAKSAAPAPTPSKKKKD